MIDFFIDNIGTIIVIAILIATITGIILKMRKDKKNGKSSCGCNCSGCANSGMCHGGRKV